MKQPMTKLCNRLYRYTQHYCDKALEKYELTSGLYPFLLVLNENEGISQKLISQELHVDKALSARAVKKLIDLGYVRRENNGEDQRACKLFITEKSKAIIPEIIKILNFWNMTITSGLNEDEKEMASSLLQKMLINAKRFKEKEF